MGLSLLSGYFLETITLFTIIIIHEIGHVAMARELGWRVTEVQMLPFGGVAVMEDAIASHPIDEIVVALAGPFMNTAMIFVSLLFWQTGLWTAEWTHFFMYSNALIAGFNLLPIWPLDGGRIVQALLALRTAYRTAALVSIGASSLLAAVMLGIGLFSLHLNTIMVALYLLVINTQSFLRFPFLFFRFLIEKYYRTSEHQAVHSITLEPGTTAIEASQSLRRGYYHMFIVTGKTGGIISEEQLLHALLVEHKYNQPLFRLL